MSTFLSVPVPRELLPKVLRLVADHLDSNEGDNRDASDERWGMSDPWEGFAEDDDGATAAAFWQHIPSATQRRLLRVLAHQSAPVSAAEVADGLGMDVSSLAGIVGPLNKTCLAAGYPAPVVSRAVTSTTSGVRKRARVLSMSPHLAKAVQALDTGEDEPVIPVLAVRKKAKSGESR